MGIMKYEGVRSEEGLIGTVSIDTVLAPLVKQFFVGEMAEELRRNPGPRS